MQMDGTMNFLYFIYLAKARSKTALIFTYFMFGQVCVPQKLQEAQRYTVSYERLIQRQIGIRL